MLPVMICEPLVPLAKEVVFTGLPHGKGHGYDFRIIGLKLLVDAEGQLFCDFCPCVDGQFYGHLQPGTVLLREKLCGNYFKQEQGADENTCRGQDNGNPVSDGPAQCLGVKTVQGIQEPFDMCVKLIKPFILFRL